MSSLEGMNARYDAVVVGARAAGAATALLLARRGLRVLAVDRGAYGSDTLSTHALMRAGVLQLGRWGLLDRIQAAGHAARPAHRLPLRGRGPRHPHQAEGRRPRPLRAAPHPARPRPRGRRRRRGRHGPPPGPRGGPRSRGHGTSRGRSPAGRGRRDAKRPSRDRDRRRRPALDRRIPRAGARHPPGPARRRQPLRLLVGPGRGRLPLVLEPRGGRRRHPDERTARSCSSRGCPRNGSPRGAGGRPRGYLRLLAEAAPDLAERLSGARLVGALHGFPGHARVPSSPVGARAGPSWATPPTSRTRSPPTASATRCATRSSSPGPSRRGGDEALADYEATRDGALHRALRRDRPHRVASSGTRPS